MNKERVLRAHRLFAYVPARVIKSIAPLFQESVLERGQVVIEHGEPSQLFFLVHRGRVKTLYRHHDEFERGAGGFFGENALLEEKSTVENAFAVQAGTELLSINRTDWNHCLNAFPVLSTAVTNMVAECLGGDGVGGCERTVGNYTISGELVRREREVWFSGEHSSLQRTLRLQLIPHVFIRDAKYRERLISRLKVIANLNEPFIVRPLDVVKSLSTYFIVYDCEDGVPLSEILTKVRSIPPAVVAAVILAAGEILAFLHAQELVHTDVRPENVLITRNGEVKIANIGITHPQYLAPEFTAPEQMQKKHVGKGADVYALGVLAYLLAAQRCPFDAREEKALLRQKLDREYADLSRINPLVPQALLEFVSRALEPKPDKRLENLSNLRDLFRLWQEPKRGREKRAAARGPELAVASREEIVRWLAKKYFQNESRKPEPNGAAAAGRNGRETFAPLFENPEDFYAFKLLTFEDFAAESYARKTELAVTFKKDELLAHLQDLERQRQELITAHVLLKKVKRCATRKDLFDILTRLLAAVEKPPRYALLARKDKKIKNLAERVAVGSAYEPDAASDRLIIEKAENNTEPFLVREKNQFILVCPLFTKTKFIGSVCIADRAKMEVDARTRFYRLVAEVIPVVELEW
ncbi:MAG: protein kinase [Spirochaetales bacterium]|nr:protein kinase [Spirochaetales bacterium]